jgi:RimJ/RimL family protein N-acetyltransferase
MRLSPADAHVIRPLRNDERDALLDLFQRLSPQSRLQRFLAPKPRLSARDLDCLSDVDGDRHDALVVVAADAPDRLLGVARLVRGAAPGSSDVSVVIEDRWQRHGLGGRLLDLLCERARRRGVESVTATVLVDNRAAVRLMRRAGRLVDVRVEAGVLELIYVL